jgi:hypothetical protein
MRSEIRAGGSVAERHPAKVVYAGSNPARRFGMHAVIAQLAEQLFRKQPVAGSIPARGLGLELSGIVQSAERPALNRKAKVRFLLPGLAGAVAQPAERRILNPLIVVRSHAAQVVFEI